MPEILPIAVPMPAAPAAPAAPVAGVAPTAAQPGQPVPADFMGQLAAALKGLKGIATAVKGLPLQPVIQPVPTADPATADATPVAAAKPVTPSDDVAELMATLGLVLLPQPQTPMPVLHAQATSEAAAPVPVSAAPQVLPQPAPTATAQLARQAEVPAELAAKLPQTPASPELVKHLTTHVETAKTALVAQPQTESPQAQTAPTVDPQPLAPHAPAPRAAVPATTPSVQPDPQNANGGFQQPSRGNDHQHSQTRPSIADAAPVRTESAAQPTFAEAALTTSAPVQAAAPAQPQAVDVAAQIAHQVDLYRLPGSKGVRIQLHPEDLGGVQVTLRYGTGGSLELHVSVEHAATGALVQDGLNHLRDALATHGFEPDRIVMSVTAPSAASQMDFNSNGSGSYRSDPGLAAFTQDGQSGQHGSQQEDAPAPRGWSAAPDADDSPRAGSPTSGGTSVIDYRV